MGRRSGAMLWKSRSVIRVEKDLKSKKGNKWITHGNLASGSQLV